MTLGVTIPARKVAGSAVFGFCRAKAQKPNVAQTATKIAILTTKRL